MPLDFGIEPGMTCRNWKEGCEFYQTELAMRGHDTWEQHTPVWGAKLIVGGECPLCRKRDEKRNYLASPQLAAASSSSHVDTRPP